MGECASRLMMIHPEVSILPVPNERASSMADMTSRSTSTWPWGHQSLDGHTFGDDQECLKRNPSLQRDIYCVFTGVSSHWVRCQLEIVYISSYTSRDPMYVLHYYSSCTLHISPRSFIIGWLGNFTIIWWKKQFLSYKGIPYGYYVLLP